MTFDSTNNSNVFSSGCSLSDSIPANNDNRANQSNQEVKKLADLGYNPLLKARCYQNYDNNKSSIYKLNELVLPKENITNGILPHDYKNKNLISAIKTGSVDSVKYWIESGADVTLRDGQERNTILHLAANRFGPERLEIAKLLLSLPQIKTNSCDLNVNSPDWFGCTALYIAASQDDAEFIKVLQSDPDIYVENLEIKPDRFRPLCVASVEENKNALAEMLSYQRIPMHKHKEVQFELDALIGDKSKFDSGDKPDFDSIEKILLNRCSKGVSDYLINSKTVYDHLMKKVNENSNLGLRLDRLSKEQSDIVSGYSKMATSGGHSKEYDEKKRVPEDLLKIVASYLNTNLMKSLP
ncbi:MAG: ankyrin repeat domain-containing protein [Desulfobacteraceae bacterium]|nr:ankyrin repeat domain-containing protein [Desulfobacteraceae bacterium]